MKRAIVRRQSVASQVDDGLCWALLLGLAEEAAASELDYDGF